MFGHDHAACHDTPLPGDTRSISLTLAQLCTGLLDALSKLASCKSILDNELQNGVEEAITAAIDAVWVARQECDRFVVDVLKTVPETSVEANARKDALAAYLTLPDADELMRSLLNASILNKVEASVPTTPSASRPFPYAVGWRWWLKLGRSPNAAQTGRGRSSSGFHGQHT